MASVSISIADDAVLTRFHRALNEAGTGASDMIEVKTEITDGAIFKVVRTDCPWAISVFRSVSMAASSHA